MTLSLTVAFTLGLASTLHCMGMCGGIMTAMSLSMPNNIQSNRGYSSFMNVAYNLGRVFSYTVAGALLGSLGYLTFGDNTQGYSYFVLQVIAAIILILIGLHVAGYFSSLNMIERMGGRLWQVLQPIAKAFFPVDSVPKALMVGAIWGWLPCGLVYSVLLWATTSADPIKAASYMLAFGLGTLPGMFAVGVAGSQFRSFMSRYSVRKLTGLCVIVFGLVALFIPFVPGSHDHHHDHHQHDHGHEHQNAHLSEHQH